MIAVIECLDDKEMPAQIHLWEDTKDGRIASRQFFCELVAEDLREIDPQLSEDAAMKQAESYLQPDDSTYTSGGSTIALMESGIILH